MTDRLDEIRARLDGVRDWPKISAASTAFVAAAPGDISFLLGEVERLRDGLAVDEYRVKWMREKAAGLESNDVIRNIAESESRYRLRAEAAEAERDRLLALRDHSVMGDTGRRIAALSQWIDDHHGKVGIEGLAATLLRISKTTEECGEADLAIRAVLGENPRKGATGDWDGVRKELFDIASAALGAWEHLDGNTGRVMEEFEQFIAALVVRAGLAEAAS